MAKLFWKSRSTINDHILNIYDEKELLESDTLRKIGNPDFTKKPVNYHNLDTRIIIIQSASLIRTFKL